MKKKVSQFVKASWPNSFTSYSGREKTMYITNNSGQEFDIEQAILNEFGYKLPFKLKTNEL